jgi:hypothetical protein
MQGIWCVFISHLSVFSYANELLQLVQEVPNRLGKGVFDALAMNVRLRSRL